MTAEDLSKRLLNVMLRPNPILFAGAGVGRRVGYPDWADFISHLAETCERHGDATSARLIHERASRAQFLSAASVFKSSDVIPEGERWKALAAPFTTAIPKENLDRLTPLVTLGFTGFVTTNYENSIHNALAHCGKGWITPFELDDGSLSGASLSTSTFVARIHGRAERPTSMVVDSADYKALANDEGYLDFLLDILKNRSCLFVGFSFLDPAISDILQTYREKVGPVFPALHSALVPEGANDLIQRLRALNIEPLEYSTADNHSDLWRSVRLASEGLTAESRKRSSSITPALQIPAVHQFMAFAYAQVLSSPARQPIAALVQDGIVLASLPSVGTGVGLDTVHQKVRQALRISIDEAKVVVDVSIQRLSAKGQVQDLGGTYLQARAVDNVLERHLKELAEHVADRARVRSGVQLNQAEGTVVRNSLESIFVWRAWDVAAHFAGSGTRLAPDLGAAVARSIEEAARGERLPNRVAIEDAVISLLTAPEDRETPLLAEIGRAAFGLQLVLATPRQVLFRRHALPETIYLDSNVLMPAITAGHPLQPIYQDALSKLAEASKSAGAVTKVVVGRQFLNEIVSHKRLAIQIAQDLELDDPAKLAQHIRFYGATPGNVFIGGYAGWSRSKSQKEAKTFEAYLRQVAPFTDETQLAEFLSKIGIRTVEMTTQSGRFAEMFGRLSTWYEQENPVRAKEKLLIEHEAQQLAQLERDAQAGHRALFVSSDAHLRRILHRDDELRPFAAAVVSHLGLVALVDVMVGLKADERSLTRLIWASPHVDQERGVINYFVSLALRDYREGAAMEMQEAAKRVANEVKAMADSEQLQLFGRRAKDITATAHLLDRFEDRFFEYWRREIERREAGDHGES